MEPVVGALAAIGNKYQQILSQSMLSASQRQQQVVQQLKDTDKTVAAASTQLQQAPDFSIEEKTAMRLRQVVSEARRSLDGVVGSLYNIDRHLPETDRLLASSQSNKIQYPLLSGLMEEIMVLRPEEVSTATSVVGIGEGQVGAEELIEPGNNGTGSGKISSVCSASDSLRRFRV